MLTKTVNFIPKLSISYQQKDDVYNNNNETGVASLVNRCHWSSLQPLSRHRSHRSRYTILHDVYSSFTRYFSTFHDFTRCLLHVLSLFYYFSRFSCTFIPLLLSILYKFSRFFSIFTPLSLSILLLFTLNLTQYPLQFSGWHRRCVRRKTMISHLKQ